LAKGQDRVNVFIYSLFVFVIFYYEKR